MDSNIKKSRVTAASDDKQRLMKEAASQLENATLKDKELIELTNTEKVKALDKRFKDCQLTGANHILKNNVEHNLPKTGINPIQGPIVVEGIEGVEVVELNERVEVVEANERVEANQDSI